MPNWVKNRLQFKGDSQQIEKLIKQFSTYVPRKVRRDYDGTIICQNSEGKIGWYDEGKNIFQHRDADDENEFPGGYHYVFSEAFTVFPDFEKVIPPPNDPSYNDEPSQQAAAESPNWWRTWNVANWGTKWNAGSCTQDYKYMHFQTAWAAPFPVIQRIAQEYPEVEIIHEWADEDTGYNVGSMGHYQGRVLGGQIEGGTKEAYDMALALWPEYLEDYELVDGEWKHKED